MSDNNNTLAGIAVPSSPIITKAMEYAQSKMDKQGYNHVMRSWLIGQALINKLPKEQSSHFDQEVYALGTILHDLGWPTTNHINEELISPDKIFEVDGANAARDFVLREGNKQEWNEHRLQLLWDLIALHATPQIADHKEAEVALGTLGIFTELIGIAVSKSVYGEKVTISEDEYNEISKAYPRTGLRGYVREVLCTLCIRKPETTYGNFVGGFGERFVDGYDRKGKEVVDLFEATVTE